MLRSVLLVLRSARTVFLWALVLHFVQFCPPAAASATERRVPQDHATIQEAIDAADGSARDVVLIGCGTYHETIVIPRGKSGVTVQSEHGDPGCVTVDAQGAGRVIYCQSNVTIDGLTLTGGDGDLFGGGLLLDDDSDGALVIRCVIRDNTARSGGGVYSFGSVTLEDCQILGNTAEGGGGLYAVGPALVSGCTFSSNTAAERGGGICGGGSFNAVVSASTFYANRAAEGSALSLRHDSSVSVDHSLIAFGEGDAIRCYESAQLEISCSDIFGNAGGDWVDLGSVGCLANRVGMDGNVSADPQFCATDPSDTGSWIVQSDSPCAPPQSGCGVMGAWDVGCGAVSTEHTTWSRLKGRFL